MFLATLLWIAARYGEAGQGLSLLQYRAETFEAFNELQNEVLSAASLFLFSPGSNPNAEYEIRDEA